MYSLLQQKALSNWAGVEMRTYETCSAGNQCINERQGQLTVEDYHNDNHSKCKKCSNLRWRELRKRKKEGFCSNSDCKNPKNGSLTARNYRSRRLSSGGTRYYSECTMCYSARQRKQKKSQKQQEPGLGDMTAHQIAACTFDVIMAQRFNLGRIEGSV